MTKNTRRHEIENVVCLNGNYCSRDLCQYGIFGKDPLCSYGKCTVRIISGFAVDLIKTKPKNLV
jgi:hypothetical protein